MGTEFQVNTYTTGDQGFPDFSASAGRWPASGGGTWDGSGPRVMPRKSSPTGQAERLTTLLVDPGIGWQRLRGLRQQLYGPTETPTLTPTETPTLTQTATPTDTPLPGGPGGPPIGGGDVPGSNEVTGTGPPNLGPTCLKVYEVGPNRVPDGGGPDDVLLGNGGTDANGNYSIMLTRPLKAGDVIFIVDTCAMPPASGPLDLITGAAAAPALSPALLAVALATLSLIALIGTRRRQRGF